MSILRLVVLSLFFLGILAIVMWLIPNRTEAPVASSTVQDKHVSIDSKNSTSRTVVSKAKAVTSQSHPIQAPIQVSSTTVQPIIPSPVTLAPSTNEGDEEQTEKDQVQAALKQINSPDPKQRVEGAEQLGAYPTKDAEIALQQLLSSDTDAEVRNTAAQSLGYVDKPTVSTLEGLLSALEDQNEDVRLSALSTLEDFMLSTEEGSKQYNKILIGLKSQANARSVPEDTRQAIHDIINDQGTTAHKE